MPRLLPILLATGRWQAKSFIRRTSPVEDTEGDPMHRVSSHPAMHRANLLYPDRRGINIAIEMLVDYWRDAAWMINIKKKTSCLIV